MNRPGPRRPGMRIGGMYGRFRWNLLGIRVEQQTEDERKANAERLRKEVEGSDRPKQRKRKFK